MIIILLQGFGIGIEGVNLKVEDCRWSPCNQKCWPSWRHTGAHKVHSPST
jgi:hypothetical protein